MLFTANHYPADKLANDSIFYTGNCGSYWTDQVDVLAVGRGSRLDLSGLAAAGERLYAVWAEAGELRVSTSQAQLAADPRAWVTDAPLPGLSVSAATMRAAEDGALHLVLVSSNRQLAYLRYSADGQPGDLVTMAESPDMDTAFTAPSLAAQDDVLVASWNRTESWNNWSPTGVFIAYSHDGGTTWSAPREISGRAGDGSSELGYDADGRVHLFWVGTLQMGGRYHVVSTDGGVTWSQPVNMAPDLTGNTGAKSFVVDSAGTLHLVFGGLGSDGEGVRYSRWEDGVWTSHVRVSGDLPQSEGGVATITGGNTIHAVWVDLEREVVYHAEMNTASPAAAPEPTHIATVAPATTATVLPESAQTPTTSPAMSQDPAGVQSERSSGYMIALMALPPAIVVAAVVLVAARRRR
ncbi:MAG: sialidase family protein [Anaerolineae bacterium]